MTGGGACEVRVKLSDSEPTETRVTYQGCEGHEGLLLAQTNVPTSIFGERCVGEVDCVHVEVNDQALAVSEDGERAFGSGNGLIGDVTDWNRRETTAIDRPEFPCRALLSTVSEENDLVAFKQRRMRADFLELRGRVGLAEQVRDSHPVERSVTNARGCIEVGVDVEVDDSQPARAREMPSDRAEPDGAVAAENKDRFAICKCRADQSRCLSCALDHGGPVLRPAVGWIRTPAPNGRVAVIDNIDANPGEPFQQPGLAQRSWRPFLAGRIGTSATWHPDYTQLHRYDNLPIEQPTLPSPERAR